MTKSQKIDDTASFVRSARDRLKLTQTELGEQVGRDRRSIWRYEQGEELPPAVRLAIMHLLAVPSIIQRKESPHAKAVRHRNRD